MQLALRVVGWPQGVAPTPLAAYFDDDGGMIGRSETARLSLADPVRMVSRFHAHISFRGGVFSIEDMGSTNPTVVNGTVLSPNQRFELALGDRVQVGGYTLAVECDDPSRAAAPRPAPRAAPRRNAQAWGDEDSVHTRFVPMEEEPALASDVMTAPSSAYYGTTVPNAPSMLLQELSRELSTSVSAAPATVPPRGGGGAPSIPSLDPTLTKTLLAEPAQPVTTEILWRAFQEGAQITIDLPGGLKPDFMRSVGAMLRRAVSGMRRLAGGGSARSRNGNTLRLASDDARALAAALRPPVPSFLTGPAAVDELMSALEAQHDAMQMALRVVVDQVLQRFEPAVLEGRLSSGVLAGVPMLRKARLWDLYAVQQRTLAAEIREGLREAFERAMATALDLDSAHNEPDRKRRG